MRLHAATYCKVSSVEDAAYSVSKPMLHLMMDSISFDEKCHAARRKKFAELRNQDHPSKVHLAEHKCLAKPRRLAMVGPDGSSAKNLAC